MAFARETAKSPASSLCAACVDLLGVTGAGITVMGGGQAGPLCVSNKRMAALEDSQYTLGEGPCYDAFHAGLPIHAPRLDPIELARWPTFVGVANEAGIGAAFAYPLVTSGARVGVLTLYQDVVGELSAAQNNDSIALSEVLTEMVLSLQDDAPAGVLAPGLEQAVTYRAEIHQACGMVAVQLQIPVAAALLRIRAYAFSTSRPVGAVAADIVARRLRLDDDKIEPQRPERPGEV
ncbi:MAG: ANTAR domain-containing protein [Ilumatobacteraceae bacterium]